MVGSKRPSPYEVLRRLDAEAERARRKRRRLHGVLVLVLFVAYSMALLSAEDDQTAATPTQTKGHAHHGPSQSGQEGEVLPVKGQMSPSKSLPVSPKGVFLSGATQSK